MLTNGRRTKSDDNSSHGLKARWAKKKHQRTVEGNAQIGVGLCFHKNQNWKSQNFYKLCWELTDLSKNLELFKMHQLNYSVCSYTFIEVK